MSQHLKVVYEHGVRRLLGQRRPAHQSLELMQRAANLGYVGTPASSPLEPVTIPARIYRILIKHGGLNVLDGALVIVDKRGAQPRPGRELVSR